MWPSCLDAAKPLAEKAIHSVYVQQLRLWLRTFDPRQFLIVSFAAMLDPKILRSIYRSVDAFLGFNARKRQERNLPKTVPLQTRPTIAYSSEAKAKVQHAFV